MLKGWHVMAALWFPCLFHGLIFFFPDRIDHYSQRDLVEHCQLLAGTADSPIYFIDSLDYSGCFYTGGGYVDMGNAGRIDGGEIPRESNRLFVVVTESPDYEFYSSLGSLRLVSEKNGYGIFITSCQ